MEKKSKGFCFIHTQAPLKAAFLRFTGLSRNSLIIIAQFHAPINKIARGISL